MNSLFNYCLVDDLLTDDEWSNSVCYTSALEKKLCSDIWQQCSLKLKRERNASYRPFHRFLKVKYLLNYNNECQ